MSTARKFFAGCSILFLVISQVRCSSRTQNGSGSIPSPAGDVVARVGDYPITRQQAEYRDKVIELYYPKDNRHLGLSQLIESYTFAQILANHGKRISSADLDKEETRIAKESLLPEKLAELQALFNGDHEAYRSVYVLPTLVQRVIYFDYFLKTPLIHQESLVRAKAFLLSAQSHPAGFAELAKKSGAASSRLVVSRGKGLQWIYEDPNIPADLANATHIPPPQNESEAKVRGKIDQQQSLAQDQEAESWIRDIAMRVKKGDLFDKVIDASDSWRVVRYLGPRTEGEYLFEAAIFPKRDFGDWLNEEKKKIEVKK